MAFYSSVLAAATGADDDCDRAALAAHCALLEHGFMCVGADGQARMDAGPSGSVMLQVVPPGWKRTDGSYSFAYVHPLRQEPEIFTMKAVVVGTTLMVHAASSLSEAELLTASLVVDRAASGDTSSAEFAARAKDWQAKVSASIAMRLLSKSNSSLRFGQALEQTVPGSSSQVEGEAAGASGTKRSAPEGDRPQPRWGQPGLEDPRFRPGLGDGRDDPFAPDFGGGRRPDLWTPDGNLLGPRHPAWGQMVPGRGGGGMMPRFDPVGPGPFGGEPDFDHFVPPGMPGMGMPGGLGGHNPATFPAFQGGATGRGGRRGPDGMFIL